VFLVEHAPRSRRGLQGSWAFASVMVGVLAGSCVATAVNWALTGDLGEQLLCRHGQATVPSMSCAWLHVVAIDMARHVVAV
jgi:hypothetical protein